jgi:hypothetical protein
VKIHTDGFLSMDQSQKRREMSAEAKADVYVEKVQY